MKLSLLIRLVTMELTTRCSELFQKNIGIK